MKRTQMHLYIICNQVVRLNLKGEEQSYLEIESLKSNSNIVLNQRLKKVLLKCTNAALEKT